MRGSPAFLKTAWIPFVLAPAWGLNWPVIKVLLATVPPFTLRALGLGAAALLLGALAVAQRRPLVPPRATWPGIFLSGLFAVVAFNMATAFAQLTTTTSRAAVLTYTMPMMSAALAWAFLGERPGQRGAWALACGGAGLALLAWPVFSAPSASWAGLAYPLLAAAAWALGTLVTKRAPPVQDRVVATAWQLALGGVCGAVAALAAGERMAGPWPAVTWGAFAYHVGVAMALAYVLWYRLLDAMSATVSSLTTLAVPVVGVLGAMAVVGERPTALDLAGFAGVLAGAALVLVPAQRRSSG
jgi:drug/metabolite transporter (DMT)-like permease